MLKADQRKQIQKRILFLLVLFITISACHPKRKFEKERWAEVADLMTFPNRKYMIDDLIHNYKLKGKTYYQIIRLLGEPQSKLDSTFKIFYNIDVDYGNDIDPVYTKTLSITFNKENVVKKIEVYEWEK
jgi:hypothetical protein